MERDRLHGLIKEKNERLERDTLRSAEQIIDSISGEQQKIRESQDRIAKLRDELKALTVKQIDSTEVLGE